MAVAPHTHTFKIPTATKDDIVAATSDNVVVTPKSIEGAFATAAQTARIEMRTPWRAPEEMGAVGDGVADDTAAVQAIIDAVGSGAEIRLNGRYRLSSKLMIIGKTLKFTGRAINGGQYTGFAMAGDGEVELTNSSGCVFDQVSFRAVAGFTPEHHLVSLLNSANAVFQGTVFTGTGVPGVRYARVTQGSNNAKFTRLQAIGATGEYGFFFGGPTPPNNATGANVLDVSFFSIGAEGNCDSIVFDGASGSAKFVNGAFNFGRRAIWAKRSGFLYFGGIGTENQTGDYPIQFDRVKEVELRGGYLNGGVQIGEFCTSVNISNARIRAGRFHGIECAGSQVNLNDNIIMRNSTSANGVYSGVRLLASCKNVGVRDNQIVREWAVSDTSDPPASVLQNALHRFAIETDAPENMGNIITSNVLTEFRTSAIGGTVPSGAHIFDNITA